MKINRLSFFPLIFVCFLAGCASSSTVYREYIASQPNKGILVDVQEIVDERPAAERGALGTVIDDRGIASDVKEPKDLKQTIKKAVEFELTSAGYQLFKSENSIHVKAIIKSASCSYKGQSRSGVRLRIIASERGKEVFNRSYEGEASYPPMFTDDCHDLFLRSLQIGLSNFIKDFDRYVTTT